MRRILFPVGCLLLTALSSGCSLCQSCLDYKSPVVNSCGQSQGDFWFRQNSVLAGNAPMSTYGPMVSTGSGVPRSGTPTPAETLPNPKPKPQTTPDTTTPETPTPDMRMPSDEDLTPTPRAARSNFRRSSEGATTTE